MHVKRVGWTKLVKTDKISSSKYKSSARKGEGTAGIVEENVVESRAFDNVTNIVVLYKI